MPTIQMSSKSRKKLTIGVLIHEIKNIVPTKLISGALKSAKDNNLNILFFIGNVLKSPHNFESQANIIYELISKERLDGFVIWSGTLVTYIGKDELIKFINSFSMPAVSIELELKNIPSLLLGDYRGMYDVLNHLIKDHGYKRIGFIRAVENQPACIERFRAYKDILKENNINFDQKLIPKGMDNWDGITEIKTLMDHYKDDLDAIASVSDACLKHAITIIKSYGKRVPEDIALIGFDNNIDMSVGEPPLTTIEPSHFNLGYEAVEILKLKIENKSISEVKVVQPKLIIRQSCGCISQSIKKSAILNKEIVKKYNKLNKKSPVDEMNRIFKNSDKKLNISWAKQLWEDFILDIKNNRGKYLNTLKNISRIILEQDTIDTLQDILSIMLYYTLKKINMSKVEKAIILIEQGRILIAEMALRVNANQSIQADELRKKLNELGQSLITSFSIDGLMSILSKELPLIGVEKCYVSLYENPSNSIEDARLILAFDKNGKKNIDAGERLFKSKLLVPSDILHDDDIGEMFVLPLYFQEEQIGFILIGTGIPEIQLYETLRSQISSALKGAKLVEQINTHSQILSKGIESLATTLEEMARNIESISSNMTQQASAITESAGAIEQMTKNIGSITERSTKAKELSDNLNNFANEGKNTVKKAMRSANEVQKNSEQILGFLELIKEIANNINVLAINASIQAAHSGQHGKGFSVVASEIKKLAYDTNKNIKNIEDEVKSIVNSIINSVNMTEGTVANLDMISVYSKQNADFISELNFSMIEQDNGAKEMLQSIHELLKITEEVKSAIIEQKKATDDFNFSLRKLNELSKKV